MTNSNAIDQIIHRISQNRLLPAIYWHGKEYSYGELMDMADEWNGCLSNYGIGSGTVTGILSDYSPQVCALFIALMRAKAILTPLSFAAEKEMPSYLPIAGVQGLFRFNEADQFVFESFPHTHENELIVSFRERQVPGLVVFTSGSTGKPKGILHDVERVMRKFTSLRDGWRTVLFLMIDHFGGFNTLLSTFAYLGTGLCVPGRSPHAVCETIQQSKATLLPTTPTFLNLLFASGSYREFDLSSIKLITYGTEVMPETTLEKVRSVFPNAQIKQTYGLSELSVLRSRSENDASLWVKVGGDGFEIKVVDGILWVRSEANMVGYLNAPSPFDADGWMCTGDQVEVKGEYIRFFGRKSEIINVGGQKVFPIEVESVLLQDSNVREATVFGFHHPLMGQVVHARISLYTPENSDEMTVRLRKLCVSKLAKYKVPVKFIVVEGEEQYGLRYKKIRHGLDESV
jgi:acyl-coenzyme A synthetase/AMP-(fatty) acid ligase